MHAKGLTQVRWDVAIVVEQKLGEKAFHHKNRYCCRAVVPNLGGIPPKGGIWPSLGGGGNEQLSKTIQHLFGLKIHLIYNYKAPDSLNFHEIKFN